jgi:hypothetical protein
VAAQCAKCGRSDLMQALVRGWQCLGCGEVTDENQNLVTPVDKGPNVSNRNIEIKELGDTAKVVLAKVGPVSVIESPGETTPEAPESPVEPTEPETEPTPNLEPETPETVELPLDLATLTPEQTEALKAALGV